MTSWECVVKSFSFMVPCCKNVLWEFFGGNGTVTDSRFLLLVVTCLRTHTPQGYCAQHRRLRFPTLPLSFSSERWILLRTALRMFLMRHLKCIANMWDVPQSTAGTAELNIKDYHWITVQWLPTPHNASMGKAFTPGSLYSRNMRGVSL